MIGICQSGRSAGFVAGVLDFIDCQAQAIGAGGYQALGAPGSAFSIVIGSLLTIFVALFGYRMLFGHTPGLRDGVLSMVKIGIVLALAFSWGAYQTLIYDVALKGPAELAAAAGRPAGLPGSAGGMVGRLDHADRSFVALGLFGTGIGPTLPAAQAQPSPQPNPQANPQPQQQASSFDPIALGAARIVFLTGALGALAAMRLIAGLMLALGPFFIAFILFSGTRGLFEGWIRVLAGTALGTLAAMIVLGVELAFIEPWLGELLAARNAGYSIPGAPVELLVVSIMFALAILASVAASWRLTVGFGLPAAWRAAPAQLAEAISGRELQVRATTRAPGSAAAASDRSRATIVADAVAATQRREHAGGGNAVFQSSPSRRAEPHADRREERAAGARPPLGQAHRRRTRGRVSAGAGRRDKGA